MVLGKKFFYDFSTFLQKFDTVKAIESEE